VTTQEAGPDPASLRSPGGRLRAPLLAAAGLLAATAIVAAVDPHQPGHYPLCPFRAVTGLDCPLCGSLRATHDLAHGQLATAASENLLLVLAAPLLALGWVGWVRRSWRSGGRSPAPSTSTRTQVLVVAVLVVFMVARNSPWGHWLASTS